MKNKIKKDRLAGIIIIIVSLISPFLTFTYAYIINDKLNTNIYSFIIFMEVLSIIILFPIGVLLIVKSIEIIEEEKEVHRTIVGSASLIICIIAFIIFIISLSPYMPLILSLVGLILFVVATRKGETRKIIAGLNIICLILSIIIAILIHVYYSRNPEIEGYWQCTPSSIQDLKEFSLDLEKKKYTIYRNNESLQGTYIVKNKSSKILHNKYEIVLNYEIYDKEYNIVEEKAETYEMYIVKFNRKEMIFTNKKAKKKYLCTK